MRITDIFLAFPRLILALAFVAALGPGHRERDHRHRAHRLAALCPPRPGRDADHPQRRLHRRGPAAGRARRCASSCGHIVPLCLSSRDRARHARHGRHHPDRRRPRLPRPRRAAAAAGMGRDDRRRPRAILLDQWWVATMPGHRHLRRQPRLQPARRRPARRARSRRRRDERRRRCSRSRTCASLPHARAASVDAVRGVSLHARPRAARHRRRIRLGQVA